MPGRGHAVEARSEPGVERGGIVQPELVEEMVQSLLCISIVCAGAEVVDAVEEGEEERE